MDTVLSWFNKNLTEKNQQILEKEFSAEEIKEVVFAMSVESLGSW